MDARKTLKDLLEASFITHSSQTAIRILRPAEDGRQWRYESMSYAELKQLRDRLATGFAAQGSSKGKRVGILDADVYGPSLPR